MSVFKQKVITNVRKQIEEQKSQRAENFKELYNKTRTFTFPKEINKEKYFYFPSVIFGEMELSKAAISIYPVICSQANFENNNWFQLPLEHIAKMAGLSVPTVSKGIQNLLEENFLYDHRTETPLLQRRKSPNTSRHIYQYKVGFVRKGMIKNWKGRMFIFHTCLIESGVWAKLKQRAKVLYLIMRSHSYFENELYSIIEGIDLGGYELNDFYHDGSQYRNRKWDTYNISVSELCRKGGIERSNLKTILEQLKIFGLAEVERIVFSEESDYLDVKKVYLKPKSKYLG